LGVPIADDREPFDDNLRAECATESRSDKPRGSVRAARAADFAKRIMDV
jgi:hypothetical protein